MTVIIPAPSAQKLVDAKKDDQKQSGVLESRIYLNGQSYALWVHEGSPPVDWQGPYAPPINKKPAETPTAAPDQPGTSEATVSPDLLKTTPTPIRILTPDTLANMQRQNQDSIDRMGKGLNDEAHFFPRSPDFHRLPPRVLPATLHKC